jgi:hypothetical protein
MVISKVLLSPFRVSGVVMNSFVVKGILMKWLGLGSRTSEKEFDSRLTSLETVFHSPSLTPELLAAIKLISPRLKLGQDEISRIIWEKEQNGTCWSEYEALHPVLARFQKPKKVLEIGPGLGRSAVFFYKKLGWQESEIHLFDGDGSSVTMYKQKYYRVGKESLQNSFCGNLGLLRALLDFNQIRNYTLFDAKRTALAELPGPYDLIYSFYSIGFHWSLELYLDDLLPLMHENTLAIFTVKKDFRGFPRLKDFHCHFIEWKTVLRKKSSRLGLLVLSKENLGLPQPKG